MEKAVFAAGCFWGVESILRKIPGVLSTTAGYCGGKTENPTYRDLKTGDSGHAEAVLVEFDPAKVSYEALLDYFFRLHDPTQLNRQMNDIGTQYRSSIFYQNEAQRMAAEKKKREVDASGKWSRPIATEIVPAVPFWEAEPEHQDYLERNPHGYNCHWLRD
jgi:methionine-S-sulfoxide reductase